MSIELQESNQQRLHHFISSSKWQAQRLMDIVTLRFWNLLQAAQLEDDCCLIIDESGNPKKGRYSAGVKRQYCGQVGKIENCQVGVFGALCAGSLVNLIQGSLFKTSKDGNKIVQAKAIISRITKELKIPVRWVCFDSFYGRNAKLLASLIKEGVDFIADVQDNLHIVTTPFQMKVPLTPSNSRGPKFKKAKPDKEVISIRSYAATIKATQWKYITVRHQSGCRKLKAWFHSKDIYVLNPLTGQCQQMILLIRKDKDESMHYSFCYCPGANLNELAYRQCKRYFIEKAFREGKKELGLNEYQTRSEQSWDKHMSMIMLAQLFLNEEKLLNYNEHQLWLTTQDVIQMIKSLLLFTKRDILQLINYLIAKQPPDKRFTTKSLYLRI